MNVPLTPVRFLRHAQEQFPNKTAVVCGERRLTYAQFGERAARLGSALRSAGLNSGDRVAFLSSNCHRFLETYYGVLEGGGVLLPLNFRLAPAELTYVLNDAGARFLFLEGQFIETVNMLRENVSSIETLVLLDGEPRAEWLHKRNYDDLLSAADSDRRDVMEFDEDSLAELFYTSGTNANPKGVMLTHRNIYLHAISMAPSETGKIFGYGRYPHNSPVPCEWLGDRTYSHTGRRQARDDASLRPRRSLPADRTRTRERLQSGADDRRGGA